eukprot:g7725.t1
MPSSPAAASRAPLALQETTQPSSSLQKAGKREDILLCPATDAIRPCSHCRRRAKTHAKCRNGCNLDVYYCSMACQTADWVKHKFVCKSLECEIAREKAEKEKLLKEELEAKMKKKKERRMKMEQYKMCLACGNPNCWKAKMYEKLVAEEEEEELFAEPVLAN